MKKEIESISKTLVFSLEDRTFDSKKSFASVLAEGDDSSKWSQQRWDIHNNVCKWIDELPNDDEEGKDNQKKNPEKP